MAIELSPSSYRCDCGHESNFFENTVREMKEMGNKKRARLADGEKDEHEIVFYKGKAIEILCPKIGRCTITDTE